VNLLFFRCTPQVVDFAKLSFEKNEEQKGTPVYISVHDVKSKVRNCFDKLFYPLFINSFYKKNKDMPLQATVAGLQQGYFVIPSNEKFPILYSFLKKKKSKKVMVFFSSCSSVNFHAELLNFLQIECSDIHGKQKQQKRTTTFFNFCEAESGILLCTNVAARGLDIPDVVRFFD
jgi:ATP-dependent RNA helicase DDX18/HAS1